MRYNLLIDLQCDEQKPVCGGCIKHGVSCDFGDAGALATTQATPGRESTDDTLIKHSSSDSPGSSLSLFTFSPGSSTTSKYTPSNRLLELRLLHNYTAFTSKTLASVNTPTIEEAWQVSVPSLALDSPCLMDAILAVSALHLRAFDPTDQSLVRAFHGHMASALSQYTTCLINGVDASNAEALFVTSALIAFQASASRRFQHDDVKQGYLQEGYNLPTQWFHSFQGVKTVVLASWKWLRDSERVRPIIASQPALALDMSPERPAFFGPLLKELDKQIESMDESKRAETRQAYEHSVAYLNWAHQKPERPRILGFPATVSRRLVELIEQRDARALCIIACFFAMIKAVDDVWWLEGVAEKEVNGIMSILPRDWWPRVDWAVRVANHKGPMDEEIWGDCWHIEGSPSAEEGFNGDVRSHIDILAQLNPTLSDNE